jgi:hypothetical protein
MYPYTKSIFMVQNIDTIVIINSYTKSMLQNIDYIVLYIELFMK